MCAGSCQERTRAVPSPEGPEDRLPRHGDVRHRHVDADRSPSNPESSNAQPGVTRGVGLDDPTGCRRRISRRRLPTMIRVATDDGEGRGCGGGKRRPIHARVRSTSSSPPPPNPSPTPTTEVTPSPPPPTPPTTDSKSPLPPPPPPPPTRVTSAADDAAAARHESGSVRHGGRHSRHRRRCFGAPVAGSASPAARERSCSATTAPSTTHTPLRPPCLLHHHRRHRHHLCRRPRRRHATPAPMMAQHRITSRPAPRAGGTNRMSPTAETAASPTSERTPPIPGGATTIELGAAAAAESMICLHAISALSNTSHWRHGTCLPLTALSASLAA